MRSTIQVFILALCLIFITSCAKESECNLPASSKMEMATLGATYVVYCDHPTNSIVENTYGKEEIFVHANMTLYFSPHPDHEEIEFREYETNETSNERYQYTYSQLLNDSFIEIPAKATISTPSTVHDQYSSRTNIVSGTSELAVVGNHYISTYIGGFAYIPIRATHAELWFYEAPGSTRELVRRVPLESLDVWKRYIRPVVDGTKL